MKLSFDKTSGIMLLAIFMACSIKTAGVGTGEETTNGRICGVIVDSLFHPVKSAKVKLIPVDYDPLRDSGAIAIAETDYSGRFIFNRVDSGYYNIHSEADEVGLYAMIPQVGVNSDTIEVASMTLLPPGTVRVHFPQNFNDEHGYVYMPGTEKYAYLTGKTTFLDFNSVPSGNLLSIAYVRTTNATPEILRKNISVSPMKETELYNVKWIYSKNIYLNTTRSGADVAGTVVDFPVLLRLTEDNFNFEEAQPSGADLLFAKKDSVFLPYEIERWDASAKKAEIWVHVDTVYGYDSTHFFTMYWGNKNAVSQSNGEAVFDTADNVRGVWHLNENTIDASALENSGSTCSAFDTVGMIGFGKKFNGVDSILIPGLLGSPESVTFSAWAKLDSSVPKGGGEILSIGDAALIRMDYDNNELGTGGAIHKSDSATFNHVGSGKFLKLTGWHFITLTFDCKEFTSTIYIDGISMKTRTDVNIPINYSNVGENTYIGKHGNGKTEFNFIGCIDEVRVYGAAKSADFVKLSYMNQRTDDRLLVFKK